MMAARAITVDPGDAEVVKNALIKRGLQLDCILTTHHHGDHTGGVSELQAAFDAKVIGPDSPNIPQVTQAVDDGQMIELMGITFTVIAVPGHTLDHIAYFAATPNPMGQPILFFVVIRFLLAGVAECLRAVMLRCVTP